MTNIRESDTFHWLQKHFGPNSNTTCWTTGSAFSQVNMEVLRRIKECFIELQTQAKLKLLLSLFHIPRRNLEEWKTALEEILEIAMVDSEQWVSMLAEAMKPYAAKAHLNLEIMEPENSKYFYELINGVHDEVARIDLADREKQIDLIPMECLYLNKTALTSLIGDMSLKPQQTHFALKKKPKAALLREQLLLKANGDEKCNSTDKKTSSPVIPLRMRGMPRTMNDTDPLKGLPSYTPQKWLNTSSPLGALTASISRSASTGKKEGGVKRLEITEQPSIFNRNKRMKKEKVDPKKVEQSGEKLKTDTPAYAAELLGDVEPLAFSYQESLPTETKTTRHRNWKTETFKDDKKTSSCTTSTITSDPDLSVFKDKDRILQNEQKEPSVPKQILGTKATTVVLIPAAVPQQVVTLSKALMEKAQEIFRTANKVSRPEKEHILKFMAGNQENPCPQLGSIVSIKLSESQENTRLADGTILPTLIEEHFLMDYGSRQWRIVKKSPKVELATFFK